MDRKPDRRAPASRFAPWRPPGLCGRAPLIGGLSHFDDGIHSLTQLATIAAALIGATAGAGDVAAGFFRNLVITGRPRWQLYSARIPGALTLLLPLNAVAYALTATLSQVLPGSQGTPSTLQMIEA